MKLADYMEREKLDDEAMAALIQSKEVSCDRTMVSRYRQGKRRPNWDVISRIAVVTDYEVTANDFMLSEAAE